MFVIKAEEFIGRNKKMPLGRQGENLARYVRYNMKELIDEFGVGTFQWVNRRPNEELPYIATNVSQIDDDACWNLTDVDTGVYGEGNCELRYYVDGVLCKTLVWNTIITKSLMQTGEVPDPYKDMVEAMAKSATAARASADEAAASAAHFVIDEALDMSSANAVQNSTVTGSLNAVNGRVDLLVTEGTSAEDTELVDIRVAYDGVTHASAGTAVRAQAQQVLLEAANAKQEINDVRTGFDGTEYNSAGEAVREQVGSLHDELTEGLTDIQTTTQAKLDEKVDFAYVEDGVAHFTSNGIELFSITGIGGGGGGGSISNAEMKMTNTSGWLSKTVSDGTDCPVSFNWYSVEDGLPTGNGTLQITVNGSTKANINIAQGDYTFNAKPYLGTGSNIVRVITSDVYGNMRAINYTISVVSLTLKSNFDAVTPKDGAFTFSYTPTGNVEKTMHFIVDGEEIGTDVITASGRQQSYIIPAQTHGAHSLLVYFDAEINSEIVRSNELYYDVICLTTGNTAPIIASAFRTTEVEQYTTIAIPYTVYDPTNITATAVLKANGNTVNTVTVDRTEHTWLYRADEVGSLALTITVNGVVKAFGLQVSESAVAAQMTTNDLVLSLSAAGRSNAEEHPERWTDGTTSCTLTGFNYTSDGWVDDGNGSTVLRVAGDARVMIPFKAFATDFRTKGETIEIDFATKDVLDYGAVILSCMNGGRGIQLTANSAVLSSEQTTANAQYKEDEHIRLSFVVEERASDRLLYTYINGVMSGVIQYPSNDNFAQAVPVNITIGSNLCTMDIYAIRIYENDLTRDQILNNWIADTQDIGTMLARYERNRVTDEYGNVVIAQLPNDLPYMIITAAELPQYKGDKKTVSVKYVDPSNSAKSFEATSVQINVQGTSSAPYPRKNYDLQFKGGFEINGNHADNYALKSTVVPFNRFVLKADVASSEGANNVELVRLFVDANPFQTREKQADPRVREGIDGFPIVLFWNDTTTGETKFYGKYNFNLPKRAPAPYGYSGFMESWEFENNTSNLLLFKSDYFNETMYVDPDSGEQKPIWRQDFEARFPSDEWLDHSKIGELATFIVSTDRAQATNATLAEPVTYGEVTYTNDTADYRLAKFKNEFPTYAELNSFLFYYIFTELFLMVDSRAKNLFIGFSGSDVTTEGRIADRKAVAEPYDMDTAIGTNNEGALVFGYSLEDTDHLSGGADVFNGQESVLWCNVRDAYPAEITQMYKNLRSLGTLSYDTVEQRFEEHQNKWCESIFNEDSYFKYIAPLTDPDSGKQATDAYLHMLQGSKKEQRIWWLYNRFRYMDSKFNAGDALSDVIQLRGYAKSNITVTPYADIYASVKYGSYLVQTRGQRNQSYELVCPLDNVNDTEIYVYSASQISSVGDLSGLKVGFADFSNGTKLTSLKVGDASSSYENPNLKTLYVGTNGLLQTIDVRNCTALGTDEQTAVDLSGAKNIEYVYFDNTAVKGVSLPNGGILKVLHLPSTVTNLTIQNQTAITEFVMPSYANITTLRLENVSSAVPTMTILNSMAAGSRIRLTGLHFECADTNEIDELLAYFDTFKGIDEHGGNVETAVVSGTVHTDTLTGAQIVAYNKRYPYLEFTADHVTSVLTYLDASGNVLYTETIVNGGNGTYDGQPSKDSDVQYVYTFIGWSKSDNNIVDLNAVNSVLADRTVYPCYSGELQKYTATFYLEASDNNGNRRILYTQNDVPYGTTPTYGGETPTTSKGDADTFPFTGWSPTLSPIMGNTQYKAVFGSPKVVAEITDSWDEIIANVNNGTASSKYQIGNYKPLDLGSEGIINMQIVGINVDEIENSHGETAQLSWIGKNALKTKHRFNPELITHYDYVEGASFKKLWGNTYASNLQYSHVGNGEATWTIVAETSGTLSIMYWMNSTNGASLNLKVNGVDIETSYSDIQTKTHSVECNKNDIVIIYAKFSLLQDGADRYCNISFSSTGEISVSESIENATIAVPVSYDRGTGAVGGWFSSELRSYILSTVVNLIPENVNNSIKRVTKVTKNYDEQGKDADWFSTETVWIPSCRELCSLYQKESLGVEYTSAYSNNSDRVVDSLRYWTRTAADIGSFREVSADGQMNGSLWSQIMNEIVIGFCT